MTLHRTVFVCALAASITALAAPVLSQTRPGDESMFNGFWDPATVGASDAWQRAVRLHATANGTATREDAERSASIRAALAKAAPLSSGGIRNRVTCAGNVCEIVAVIPGTLVPEEAEFQRLTKSIIESVNALKNGTPLNTYLIPTRRQAGDDAGVAGYVGY